MRNVSVDTEADLVDEVVAEVDLVGVEIAAQPLCIKRFATNVESHARYLLGQLVIGQCIAMFVLGVKKKLEIIETGIDSRKRIMTATKLLSSQILEAISVRGVVMN